MVLRSIIFCVLILLVGNINAQGDPLVMMSIDELTEIAECISKSGNSEACDAFIKCNDDMLEQVYEAWEKCNKEMNPNPLECSEGKELYQPFSIFRQIFDCSTKYIKELTEKEKDMMKNVEECKRKAYETAGCANAT